MSFLVDMQMYTIHIEAMIGDGFPVSSPALCLLFKYKKFLFLFEFLLFLLKFLNVKYMSII